MRLFVKASLLLVASTLVAMPALAEWKGKGEAGIVFARGNSDTDTANVKVEMATEIDRWKHGWGVSALRASNDGDKTAERYEGKWQSDYKFSERDYWWGGLRYEDDRFSGFDYQATATTGYGRKFIDTEKTKLNGEVGLGYRRLSTLDRTIGVPPALTLIPGSTEGDIIARGFLGYENALTDTTKVLNKFTVEAGSDNTFASNELALQVKMSEAFALSLGFGVRYNTDPPAGLKKSDTLTTVNLVYAF
jgi:putative salt-induced outer membrane protein